MAFTTPHLNARVYLIITAVLLLGFAVSFISQSPSDDVRGVKSREYARRIQKQIAKKRPRVKQSKPKTVVRYIPLTDDNVLVAGCFDVGVTLRRLRPAQKTDARAVQERTRILVRKKGGSEEKTLMMVPARTESETSFTDGDLLKLTVGSPFEAYLYILNKERYADGT